MRHLGDLISLVTSAKPISFRAARMAFCWLLGWRRQFFGWGINSLALTRLNSLTRSRIIIFATPRCYWFSVSFFDLGVAYSKTSLTSDGVGDVPHQHF